MIDNNASNVTSAGAAATPVQLHQKGGLRADVQQLQIMCSAATAATLETQMWLCLVAQTSLLAEVAQQRNVPMVNGHLSAPALVTAVRDWVHNTSDEEKVTSMSVNAQKMAMRHACEQ